MSDCLEDIKEVVIQPDKIILSKFRENVVQYYKFNKIKKKYLLVSVKFLNGDGFVITAFYTSKIGK